MSQLVGRFQRDIKSILWGSLGLFTSLALLSFNPQDPSFNSTGHKSAVHNLCGYFGSFLSDSLYQLFGIAAWILVLSCMRLSWKALKGDKLQLSKTRLALAALLLLVTTSLLALYLPKAKIFADTIYVSGILGLLTSKALVAIFNNAGVAVILWSTGLVLIVFYTEQTLKQGFDWFSKPVIGSLFNFKRFKIKSPVLETREEAKKLLSLLENYKINKQEATKVVEVPAVEEKPQFVIRSIFGSEEKKTTKHITDFKRKIENWELPKLNMLESTGTNKFKVDEKIIKRNTLILEDKLAQFGVNGKVVAVLPGPAVTMFEFKPNSDVKISKITELADDLSLALSSESVRIIAPLPGRDVVGIETSNNERDTVFLSDILENVNFWDDEMKLPLALGKQANGETRVVDLRKCLTF